MRITLGNTDGKAYGLNANEACVLAVIEKCSKGDTAKGWYGSMQTLAEVMPCKIGRMSVARAVTKLLDLGLIREENAKLFANAQNEQSDAQNGQSDAQNEQKNAQIELPPYPPIYKEEENNKGCIARTITRDAWVALRKEFSVFWARAKPAAEYANRYKSCELLWSSKSEAERRQLLAEVESSPLPSDVNPWRYVANFKPREPIDWNGQHAPEPTEIACYNGHWGMYTLTDIQLFNLQTKSKQ